jgi:hypothetical protein
VPLGLVLGADLTRLLPLRGILGGGLGGSSFSPEGGTSQEAGHERRVDGGDRPVAFQTGEDDDRQQTTAAAREKAMFAVTVPRLRSRATSSDRWLR